MEIKELQLFLHLCKTLHFGKTSREFRLSPSTLTRIIQKLEHEVGELLFERDNRTATLTVAGQRFREYAIETLDRWQTLKLELQQQSDVLSGRLSIFCSVTASYSFLHELLDQFRLQYPAVEIQLHTGDTALTIQRILDEEEDVGIAARPDRLPEKLHFHTIRQSPLVFIAPLVACPLRELLGEHGDGLPWERIPLILSESGLARTRVDQWLQDRKIRPNIYAQVSGNEAIVSMVSLGFGVGVVPQLVVENSPMRGKIEILRVQPEMEPFSIGLCTLTRKLNNPLIKAFWDMSLEHIATPPFRLQRQSNSGCV
ncbi:MAG: HTH-type transcriptional activator IlvY [Gammaproteobacteria bacterium]|nr:HTH-type transcriptional activator IlvY [Gammaproteobacteria bacterium]MDP2141891.1 HTH-type transcriptional activator IlvY [Gammaproteobacteria bacterium]MDP2347227.1 HTH-type transcriptional activator IlvY [Gammaproteobacteria bacterium]